MALVGESRLRNNAVVVAAAIFITLLRVSDFAAAQTTLKFTLEGKLAGPVAPFTLGIDKGYYAAEELNVTIDSARDAAPAPWLDEFPPLRRCSSRGACGRPSR